MNPIRAAIDQKLAGDAQLMALATGGVHYRKAPHGTVPPIVIFSRYSPSTPRYTFAGPGLDSEGWLVKGVAEKVRVAEEINARCRELLDGASLVITDTLCHYMRRENDFDLDEEVDGESYEHVGVIYRLISEPTS